MMHQVPHKQVVHRDLSALWTLLAFAGSTFAQSTTSDPQVITLNPFEVKADSIRGFVATSSLAGGRLAGELKEEMKRSA
jgi:hypothetical protein